MDNVLELISNYKTSAERISELFGIEEKQLRASPLLDDTHYWWTLYGDNLMLGLSIISHLNDYINGKGVTIKDIQRYSITYAPDPWQYDKYILYTVEMDGHGVRTRIVLSEEKRLKFRLMANETE
jgi:hypothetical protein